MSKNVLAIATCRVSTPEQVTNNSLSRQHDNVLKASSELGAPIVKYWSGHMSSKSGTNVKRKDIKEMLDFCKKNRRVKYLIVDEPDRFMRSIKEASYFEVLFEVEAGVKIWYASDPELNKDDMGAKLLKFSKYFTAEGSNDERISKSISGQTTALSSGRYPFNPKRGYMRGRQSGIPEIHPVRGPALKRVLIRIAEHKVTPTQGLIELNKSDYTLERAPLKMDKFRTIATDGFYAGIIDVNKQVKVHNEAGLHDPLISIEQHKEIVRIFTNKRKYQSGPRKNGNPEFLLNTITIHTPCHDQKNMGKLVGFNHTNGKNPNIIYKRYKCRSCGLYMNRDELHSKVAQQFTKYLIAKDGAKALLDALDIVWKQKDAQTRQDCIRLNQKIRTKKEDVSSRALAAVDPSNALIKDELMVYIEEIKKEIAEHEDELEMLSQKSDDDRRQFMEFALNFVNDIGKKFFSLTPEHAKKCKQILFPGGFHVDENENVFTPEISPLIRLAANKKDAQASDLVQMVRVRRL